MHFISCLAETCKTLLTSFFLFYLLLYCIIRFSTGQRSIQRHFNAFNVLGYARWMRLCRRCVTSIEARAREDNGQEAEAEELAIPDLFDFSPFPEESDFIPAPLTPLPDIPEDWDWEILIYTNLPFQHEL